MLREEKITSLARPRVLAFFSPLGFSSSGLLMKQNKQTEKSHWNHAKAESKQEKKHREQQMFTHTYAPNRIPLFYAFFCSFCVGLAGEEIKSVNMREPIGARYVSCEWSRESNTSSAFNSGRDCVRYPNSREAWEAEKEAKWRSKPVAREYKKMWSSAEPLITSETIKLHLEPSAGRFSGRQPVAEANFNVQFSLAIRLVRRFKMKSKTCARDCDVVKVFFISLPLVIHRNLSHKISFGRGWTFYNKLKAKSKTHRKNTKKTLHENWKNFFQL